MPCVSCGPYTDHSSRVTCPAGRVQKKKKKKPKPFNLCPHPFSANIPPLLVETLNKHFHWVLCPERVWAGPLIVGALDHESWRRDRCAEWTPLFDWRTIRVVPLENWNFLRLFLSGRGSVSLTPPCTRRKPVTSSSHHFRFVLFLSHPPPPPSHVSPVIHPCSFLPWRKQQEEQFFLIIICSLRRNTIWNRRLTSKSASAKGRPNCWPPANIQVKPWKRPKRCRHQTSAWMSTCRSCSRENAIQSGRRPAQGTDVANWNDFESGPIRFSFYFRPMTVVGSGNLNLFLKTKNITVSLTWKKKKKLVSFARFSLINSRGVTCVEIFSFRWGSVTHPGAKCVNTFLLLFANN